MKQTITIEIDVPRKDSEGEPFEIYEYQLSEIECAVRKAIPECTCATAGVE